MNENLQYEFDFSPLPVFRVGCRVEGEIQIYEVAAVEHRQARSFVKADVTNARPILVRIK
jgi:hypothetical protein